MLYDLKQEDIDDVVLLIRSPTLTIPANNAMRVAHLQQVFGTAKPTTLVADLTKEIEVVRDQLRTAQETMDQCITVRDHAQLEAGLAKGRADALELCARGECDPATCASTRHQL